MTNRAALIGRIRKLLVRADAGGNEYEAQRALEAAQRLLEQYGLNEDEVRQVQEAALGVIESQVTFPEPLERYYWHGLLVYTTAKYNFCGTVPSITRTAIIGPHPNVFRTLNMYAFIAGQIEGLRGDDPSYCFGVVNRIRSRLSAQRGREVHAEDGTTLAPTHRALVEAYIAKRYPPKLVKGGEQPLPPVDWAAWQEGFDHGFLIKLEVPLGYYTGMGRSGEGDGGSTG